ncbi:MAG: OmpA family protein [Oscillospiraceae bacterium]|nr:OmpA family protein [Oscillospiraceae bacterium]
MSSASDRRKSSGSGEESSGAYWMDTYGDLVTLLLTFFVLLFSMSNIDAAKWKALVGSFTGISPIGVDPISVEVAIENPVPRVGVRTDNKDGSSENQGTANLEELREMHALMALFIEDGGLDAEIILEEDQYLVRVIFEEQVFFDTADATVRPASYVTLDAVIEMLKTVEHLYSYVIVEGHADSRPIRTAQYPSNWHISAYRAVNVLGYIYGVGELDESRLAAVGYGDKHPVVPNDSPENMAKNRRVEFIVEAGNRGQRNRQDYQ